MNRLSLALVSVISIAGALPAVTVHAAQLSEQSIEQASYTDAELDSLLAPVALYPDSLLTHIFIAATYPLEVITVKFSMM